jgi:hypothetical protein
MSQFKTLLVTHVWNEALYLRGWLRHHRPLFDHGVIILTPSGDATAKIIADEVPGWTVVAPWAPKLTTGVLERQVESIELEHRSWWKMCLTVTEYLLTNDLNSILDRAPGPALLVSGYGLVDSEAERSMPYDPAVPVFRQRRHGFDMRKVEVPDRNWGRRLLHRHPQGQYGPGRHWTHHGDAADFPGLCLARAFYAPFNEQGLARKLGMGGGISDLDKAKGHCYEHFLTREQMEVEYGKLLAKSGPLGSELEVGDA